MRNHRLLYTSVLFSAFLGFGLSGVGCGDDPPNNFTGGSGGTAGDGGAGATGGGGSGEGGCINDAQCDDGEVCEQGQCLPQHCVNTTLDGDESDVDCGGSCLLCDNGKICDDAADCQSMFCDSESGQGGGQAGGAGGGGGAEPAGPGVCAPCASHADCEGADGTFCEAGVCVPVYEQGEACAEHEQCATGFCPGDDGVCCDTNCTDTCESCSAAKTGLDDGVCGAVTMGEDPDAECADTGAASCGANGMGCNGNAAAPGCTVYPAATVCAAAACIGSELSPSWSCDGGGTCVADTPTSCAPYACNDAGDACQTNCTDHADCDSDNYCNGTTCVPKKGNGNGCVDNEECTSGACPGDGICCNVACDGLCESCLASLTGGVNGTCSFVSAGTDPENECSAVTAPNCDGAGMCSL